MTKTLSAGRFRGLMTLADDRGVFKMLAVDQRPPIFKALAKHKQRQPSEVRYDEVAAVKTLLTRILAPETSAILIDPVWTHPHALAYIPGRVGLLSTLEDYSFKLHDGERWSYPIPDWSVAKIKRSGAAAVKVLAWDRPDVRQDTREHQDAFVREVGAACKKHDIPYVLELLIYPMPGEEDDSFAYAKAKPQLVLDSVRHYADDSFGADLLKLEFPVNLKYCREFAGGAFDGKARAPAYTLAETREFLAELNELSHVPWVLLSAGVGPSEFALNLDLAFAAGASGFLAGRAVWMEALDAYPDMEAVEAALKTQAVPYLRQISALADKALPWTSHHAFGGQPKLEAASEQWLKDYLA